ARIGDRVLIDFKGQIDDQDFPGDKGDSTSIVLGNGTMLKDFEDQLVGLGARAETVFDLTFPADYRAAHIAGKTAQFQVKIHRVEQSVLPELDEDFAKSFDVKTGGMAGLRQSLRDNMEHELRDSIKAMVKHQALQGLLAANPIPLPQALIDAEIENLARQLHFPANAPDEQSQQRKAQLFGAEARQRVALGLLMSRVVAAQDLRADEQRVQAHLAMVATNYEEPAEVIRSYEQNPQVMENVRALVIEDRVVEWLLAQAQVTEKPGTFAEIMKPAPSQAEPADQPPSTQESAA
nr:trigger factor [Candidatus Contendobacter sp.]